jgi:hypothetical protein
MNMENQTIPSTKILDFVPKAVAAIVSLSALGYFAGWREAKAYYSALGATWVASSVSASSLLQLSATTIVAIVFGAFYSLVLLNDKKLSPRKLSLACAVLLLISTIALSTSQGLFGHPPAIAAYSLAILGSTLCAVAAGVTLTELYCNTRTSPGAPPTNHLWLLYWFVLPGLFWAPDRLGQAQALRDMDPTTSPLPIVSIDATQGSGTWRLVQILQDKALLIRIGAKESSTQFKIVDAREINLIESTKK